MAKLVLSNLKKSFGSVDVIPGVDLEIEDGEFAVFVGPSGCGKSTLLRLIAGLEDATSGDIRIDGRSVAKVPAADRGVAMVFQSYALYPHMSVRENLSFGLENIRMPKAEIDTRVANAARLLQIDQLLERRPRQLSGGQRQRVAIGRAITRDPEIFLFDEPLSNLDAELRVVMRAEITALHQRLKNTMIYVTHDQIEALTMATKIVVLRGGVIEQVGAPLELYNNPRNTFVAGFIGSPRMNFIEGTIRSLGATSVIVEAIGLPQIEFPGISPDLAAGQLVTIGVRPEHLEASSAADAWPLRIDIAEQHGAASYLHCSVDGGTRIMVHQPGQSPVRSGDVLRVLPAPGQWRLFDAAGLRIDLACVAS